jgi:hypothetical protein
MYPRNIGRALGIGVRVAGRIAGQRIAASSQSAANRPGGANRSANRSAPRVDINSVRAQSAVAAAASTIRPQSQAQAASRTAAQASRGLRSGISGFLRPFRRIGGIVWLEVTGSFFLLFAAIFALRLWQNWPGISGISKDFAIGAAVVFLYLGVSSFWRARRR